MNELLMILIAWSIGGAGFALISAMSGTSGRLRNLGNRHRMSFALDSRGELLDGPEVTQVLMELYERESAAWGLAQTCFGLGLLLPLLGIAPSQSTLVSVASAVLLAASAVLPSLMLRPLFARFSSGVDVPPRVASTEDYLAPLFRALGWVAAVGALAIPVGFALLAGETWFDGRDVYWEAIVLVPLAGVVGLVLLESSTRRIPDVPDPDDPSLLYLWDGMRQASVLAAYRSVLLVLGAANFIAAAVLVGIALEDPHPAWVEKAAFALVVLGLVWIAAVVSTVSDRRRFRACLWPDLDARELVPFGDARFAGRHWQ